MTTPDVPLSRRDLAHWWDHARCRHIDEAVFFPGPGDHKAVAYAKAVCAGCPVLTKCRDWVLDLESRQVKSHLDAGVVAGMTPHARRELINKRRAEETTS